jgi:hypothetical protein
MILIKNYKAINSLLDNQHKAGIMMFADNSWFFRMELET